MTTLCSVSILSDALWGKKSYSSNELKNTGISCHFNRHNSKIIVAFVCTCDMSHGSIKMQSESHSH